MAMFDFKDSEDIKAKNCTTTADALMKGERLKRVEAENCHAGNPKPVGMAPEGPEKLSSKVRFWIVENTIKATIGGVITVIVAVVITYYQLN